MRVLCRIWASATLVAALTTAGACGRAEWSVTVQPLPSPAGPDSSEPQLTGADNNLVLSWIERSGSLTHLKFSRRTPTGWTPAVTAASGEQWFLSYADVPSVTRLSDGTLVAQWLEETDRLSEAYDLLLSYSKDEGKTWAPSFMPHHDGTTTQHGFASLFEMPGGGLGLVWLDARAYELDPDDAKGGAMSLRFAAFDTGWNQTADIPVDLRVCECCSTTAVVTSDGVLAAFRDRSATEIRDIFVSRLEKGQWTSPSAIYDDGWEMYSCPVNGPMLSARGRNVVAAWFTVRNDRGEAWTAFSDDAGWSWGAPIRLDDAGALGRVDVELLDDGSAAATWVEFADRKAEFRMRRVEPSGSKSPPMTIAGVSGARASGFPRIARHGAELVFAWTESTTGDRGGALSVRTAAGPLPR
jgi:hypothetical protein